MAAVLLGAAAGEEAGGNEAPPVATPPPCAGRAAAGGDSAPGEAQLSRDLLLVLFKPLCINDLAQVLLVCRAWRAAALDPALPAWVRLDADTFHAVCPAGSEGHDGHSRSTPRSRRPHWKPPSLIGARGGQLSRQALERACARCPGLRDLDVSSMSRVDDGLLSMVGARCPALQRLKLHDSCSLSSSVSTRGIIQLCGACPGLTSLDISFTNVSDRGIAALSALAHLGSVRAHHCARITGLSLPQLLPKCTKLHEVIRERA